MEKFENIFQLLQSKTEIFLFSSHIKIAWTTKDSKGSTMPFFDFFKKQAHPITKLF